MSQKVAPDLRKWMRANTIFQPDLFRELVKADVTHRNGIEHITQDQFDEIKRAVTVARAEENRDRNARARNEKLLAKFEKLWRQASGIPKPSAMRGGRGGRRGGGRGTPTESPPPATAPSAPNLKRFMQSNSIFSTDLYRQLARMGVETEDDIGTLTETDHDELVRFVRNARVSDNNDAGARRRTDELLARFEKIWRRRSGIPRPSALDSIDDSKRAESPAVSRPTSPKLRTWLQQNQCWNADLYDALLDIGIEDPEQIAEITEDEFEALKRAVAVARANENSDREARDRADKMMSTFEKKWRARSGIRKSALPAYDDDDDDDDPPAHDPDETQYV